jgi:hypothetical protein
MPFWHIAPKPVSVDRHGVAANAAVPSIAHMAAARTNLPMFRVPYRMMIP